ncbi:MAG: N-acetylmuramoyl-L-alanine amidase [Ignavibacteriaceae bacterium]|nr:N-acetylmuramoyl-L-alanine amidase [Ignavibacteriaceae bacterium]
MTKKIFRLLFLPLLLIAILPGCTTTLVVNYELPVEFRKPEKMTDFIDQHKKHLTGKTFFLDPGHGGEDRRSKGPEGKVVEADVNLRVALYLRDFLSMAGANVIMSRTKDSTVSLNDRSMMANQSNADIFISVHHNAPGSSADNWINYVSTYYHAKETDYEYEPMEQDLARFIQRDMAYAMRQSGGLGSFDGTYSDYIIYPGKGFAVLRNTTIPAVLVECSFFTNPAEEQRLAIDEYNRIQAWGIFRGVSRYYRAGFPVISFSGARKINNRESELTFILRDSVGILQNSITVYLDSVKTENYSYSPKTQEVRMRVSEDKPSYIRIIAANKNKNFALPFHFNYPEK